MFLLHLRKISPAFRNFTERTDNSRRRQPPQKNKDKKRCVAAPAHTQTRRRPSSRSFSNTGVCGWWRGPSSASCSPRGPEVSCEFCSTGSLCAHEMELDADTSALMESNLTLRGGDPSSEEDLENEEAHEEGEEDGEEDVTTPGGRGRGRGRPRGKGKGRKAGGSAGAGDPDGSCALESGGGAPGKTAAEEKRTVKRKCPGCAKLFPDDEFNFPAKQIFCFPCKRALDCIAKQARKEDKMSWLSDVRNDPTKVKAMLDSYRARFPLGMPSKKSSAFKLLEYMESLRTFTSGEVKRSSKMMWKGEFMEFAQSVEGGKVSEDDAEQMPTS